MARPNPPGVSSTPSGRGFLSLFQTLRGATRSICRKRKEKVARSPGGARRAESEGESGRGKAHKPGLKSASQAAVRAGLDKTGAGHDPRGGRSRFVLTGPPPSGGRSRCTKRGAVAIRITTDPLPAGGRSKYIATGPPGYCDRPPPRSDSFI